MPKSRARGRFDPHEAAAAERALFALRLERLTDEMAALVTSGVPESLPVGPRAVLGGILDVAWAPLAALGLAAGLSTLGILPAALALALSWGLWFAVWRQSEQAGLAEGEAAAQAFDEACPADHPVFAEAPEIRHERAASRPPRAVVGLSVEIHEPLARVTRLLAWGLIALLQVGLSVLLLLGISDPANPGPLLGLAIGALGLSFSILAHDLDIAARAALLPGVARTSGAHLLFVAHCTRLARQLRELEEEGEGLGLPPIASAGALEALEALRQKE